MSPSWPRIIAHVDMDAFFASIEQRDFPQLRGKPIAVTNGEAGSCIITRSYEARAFGIKTGMRLPEAKRLCPQLRQCPSRPTVYANVSRQMLAVLKNFTPDIEVFSVDEAFLEFTYCRKLYGDFTALAKAIKHSVWQTVQLNCSVGISGDKTTAKFASSVSKPNGFKIVAPWQAKQELQFVPVNNLCGIGPGIAKFLAQYGVYYCGEIEKIPISVLSQRFGNLGRRIWLMCQGKDPMALQKISGDAKSLGHGKVLPPNTKDKETILYFLCHMAEKVGARLRANQLEANHFWIGLRLQEEWLTTHAKSSLPTQDGNLIYKMAKRLVEIQWHGEGVFQCQITALSPQPEKLQYDLFSDPLESTMRGGKTATAARVNKIADQINARFGQDSIVCATRLGALETPDVISPSWKPEKF